MAVSSSMLAKIRTAPPQWPHVLTSMLTKSPGAIWNSRKAGSTGGGQDARSKTRLRRCAQVIERCFSSGLRWSLLAPVDASSVGGRLPRPDGVSCARNFAFGAKTPWKRVRWARGGGTRAASLAMTNRQDCRFGRPQVARRVAHRDVRHQVDRLKLHVRRAVSPRRLELVPHPTLRRERQALLRDRRARDVAAQAFELLALVRLGGDARMQRETADLANVAFRRAVIGWGRLQRRHLAPGVRAGGDAIGDRTHPQCVQAVVAASPLGQEGGFVFAFEPAFANQMPAHTVRDLFSQVRELRGRGRTGAAQRRTAS